MWPVYKNYNNTDGAADNTCFEVFTATPSGCEDFETGYPLGSVIDNHADWFAGGAGPTIQAGIGVVGSVGLTNASQIFTWTAKPFTWTDPTVGGVDVQMDFQTDGSGEFDDDRVGWMISDSSTSSDYIFGVQLDNASGHLRLEGYWDHIINVDEDKRPEMADLDGAPLAANAWYRLRAEFTKLTDSSANVYAEVWSLDGAGDPDQLIASGEIVDTSTLGGDAPDPAYFENTLWPAYKNHTGTAGYADNTCFEIVTAGPDQHTLTVNVVGGGQVTKDPDQALYDLNDVVQLTAVADSGWLFNGWSGDLTGTDNPADLTITGDMEVTATFIQEQAPAGVCEDFETGYTLGEELRTHDDWFYDDANSGPLVQAGIGVNGSIGLTNGDRAFTWVAKPFSWNDPALTGVVFQMDYQTDAVGTFDDDRLGWSISDTDDSSDNIFGVQMDPDGTGAGGNIECYWDGDTFGDNGGRTSIVDLPALSGNTWYRLRAEFTKLTATSARIDVELTELDAAGDPVGVVAGGSIPDTDLLPNTTDNEIPNPAYFTADTMWPVYKNYDAVEGTADNTCFEVIERFAFVVVSDPHTSSYQANVENNLQQISEWLDNPTPAMPAPEFMVIVGDFPHWWQTQDSIDLVLGTGFLWYPVIGNHEISDDIANFFYLRDTMIPSLPFIVDYGPAGSVNSTYSWDYGNAHFVSINCYWDGTTNAGADYAADGDIPEALRDWINADLVSSGQTHNFAFVHDPAYPDDRHVGDSLDQYPANRDAFVATLDNNNVLTLFCGHTHYYDHFTSADYPLLGNMHQVTSAALRNLSGQDGASITYVLIEGDSVTYKVYYSTTGYPFGLIEEWTMGGEAPTEPPEAPSDLSATVISYAQINLEWTDNANNESGFEIERSTDGSGGPFTLLDTVGANTTTYADTGLIAESEYCYRVRAINVVGESDYTSVACEVTPEQPPVVGTCEDFESGFAGYNVGSHPDWFDGGNGPVASTGIGVAGSVGLAPASAIFTWTAQPFDWNDPNFLGINLQMDFQTDGSGHLDDDRVGWMTSDTSTSSDYICGVQLDLGGSGYNIEGYWDVYADGDDLGRPSIVDLPVLNANAWYRLRAAFTKLSATSFAVNVTLTALDGAGNPGAVVASGSIADTDLLDPDEQPNAKYFTGPIWPAYKNYTAVDGSVDNACFEILHGEPSGRVTSGQVVLYTFMEGSGTTIQDVSGVGTPMNLTIHNPAAVNWLPSGGLSVDDSALIDSSSPATKLTDALKAGNALTIEAWLTPANTTQNGPARIVTLSGDPYVRNVTLGQGVANAGSDRYDFRLRTTTTTTNGIPSVSTDRGTLSASLTHVVYTRNAAGAVTIYLDGEPVTTGTVGGTLSNWDSGFKLGLANELTGDRPWLGELYLVAIFDRALSGPEVEQNFLAGPTGEPGEPEPPVITQHPQDKTVTEGDDATFTVVASGMDLSYQWRQWQIDSWEDIAGETDDHYTMENVQMANDGMMVRCVVSNPAGSVQSDAATLNVTEAGVGRVTDGQVVLYAFMEGGGSTVQDVSGVGTPLDLTISNTSAVDWLPDGGLVVESSTVIASAGAATKVINAVKASNAITVEAWVSPANTTQDGPARIVTLSADPHARNFTLGQGVAFAGGDRYDVRLRTTETSDSGIPSVSTARGTLSVNLTHVVYTRNAAGAVTIYLDGEPATSDTVGGSLSNWEDGFGLGLANELTGDRPWLGEFHLVAIFDRALSAAEVEQNYLAGVDGGIVPPPPPPPLPTGLIVQYEFDEGQGDTLHDTSGNGDPLDLRIADPSAVSWLSGGGLSVVDSTTIASSTAAVKVIEAIQISEALTIEVWIAPANAMQNGPARIVTLSANPYLRNFTLGQGVANAGDDRYDVRLRTTATSTNGTPSVSTERGTLSPALTHVVYTRDADGQAVIYLNGEAVTADTVAGSLSNWDDGFHFGLANELTGDRPWLGEFHRLAIYDRALSETEVVQHFAVGP